MSVRGRLLVLQIEHRCDGPGVSPSADYESLSDTYRSARCTPRYVQARRLLKTARRSRVAAMDYAALTWLLKLLSAMPELIVSHVHDLWSELTFRSSFRYGPETNRSERTHRLLIPHEHFSAHDRDVELALIRSDMHALSVAVEPLTQGFAPLGRVDDRGICPASSKRVVACVARLAESRRFMLSGARGVHASYQRVMRHYTLDVALPDYDGLSLHAQQVCRRNAWADLLAVGLYALDRSTPE